MFTAILLSLSLLFTQTAPRTPTDTMREFYRLMREKQFREAFGLSIYRPAIEGLSAQEFEDLRPDFEKMAIAVSEKIPDKIDVSGEQISGDTATVFVKVVDGDGKEKIEPASLIKLNNSWIVGSQEDLRMVQQAGKKFFFEARLNAHHSDVQDMLTRISVAQVAYAGTHNSGFGNMAELITAGFLPKDI